MQVQLIENRGYKAEVHHVTTEDGYIVELHRIPHASGEPVLLQHGLLGSSADWLISPTNKSLGQ